MKSRKWPLISLAVVLGVAVAVGFASWRIGRPAAVAKQVWKATIPIGGGRLGSHASNTVAVAISSDGHVFFAALEDGTVRSWSKEWDTDQFEGLYGVTPGQLDPEHATPDGNTRIPLSLTDLAITPDADLAVMGFAVYGQTNSVKGPVPDRPRTGTVRVWDFREQRNRFSVTLPDPVDVVSISPHGETVAVSAGPHALRVLDGASGKLLWSEGKDGHRFGPLTFSPDGKLLAAGVGRQVNVYDARSGRLRRECSEPGGGMVAVCFSADGSRVAAGGVDQNLYVWDLSDPKRDLVLPLGVRAPVEPQVDALSFDEKSGSLVAFIRREERPGFFERWQNPPPPGITITNITGSLIVRRELKPDGKTTLLLETDKLFSKVRFAERAPRFVQSTTRDPWVGVWEY